MSFLDLFRRPARKAARKSTRSRLSLENLEDRAVPATVFSLQQFSDNIRSYFEGNSIGFAYAVREGNVLIADGFGDARTDIDGQQDFTEFTRMTSASVAKTITGTALLKILQDDPNISLGSSIVPYLPSSWVIGPNIEDITFRELLTHRSGLRRIDWDGSGAENPDNPDYVDWNGDGEDDWEASLGEQTSYNGLKQLIELGIPDDQVASRKAEHEYENANFALMRVMTAYLLGNGDAADEAEQPDVYTADAYVTYVRANVLTPMGIQNADTKPVDESTAILQYDFPADGANGSPYLDRKLWAGGEGWWLSAEDYIKFLRGIRVVGGNDNVLSQNTRQLMHQQFLGLLDPADWADDNIIVTTMFGTSYGHGGDLSRLNTAILSFPNDVHAALLLNSDWDGSAFPHPSGAHQVTLLNRAYENAWPQIDIHGTGGDDTFVIQTNGSDPNAIDIFLNGTRIVTRWNETLDKVTLHGFGGNDTFEIRQLPASITVECLGGANDDTVVMGKDGIAANVAGTVIARGGSGTDSLKYDDSATGWLGENYTIHAAVIERSYNPGLFYYLETEEVALRAGKLDDYFYVKTTAAGTHYRLYGGGSDDTFQVGTGNFAVQLGGTLYMEGQEGYDYVYFNDQNSTGASSYWLDTFSLDKTNYFSRVTFASVDDISITGNNQNSTTDIVNVASKNHVTINGQGGEDVVRLSGSETLSHVRFNAGSGSDRLELTTIFGDLRDIDGNIVFNGGTGLLDRIVMNDTSSGDGASYTFDNVLGEGVFDRNDFGRLSYFGAERLEVSSNNQNNHFRVHGLIENVALALNGNGGHDKFHLTETRDDLDWVGQGVLTLNGGAGTDSLFLYDTADTGNDTYTLTSSTFTRSGLATWSYSGMEVMTLDANRGNNTISVSSLGQVDLDINAGIGTDTVNIGNGRLDFIWGDVAVTGGAGSDFLRIHDQNATGDRDYTLTGFSFDTDAFLFGSLTFNSFSSVYLWAGQDDDHIVAEGSFNGTSVNLFGTGGHDTIEVGNGIVGFGGNVFVHGGEGVDKVYFEDGSRGGNETYDITSATVTRGSQTLLYFDVNELTVRAGTGNNTINVNNTSATMAVKIEAGTGKDTIHLAPLTKNLDVIAGTVYVNGQAGQDTLVLHDENRVTGTEYSIWQDGTMRLGFGGAFHQNLETLNLMMGSGNDIAHVLETTKNMAVNLHGRGGDDVFEIHLQPQLANAGGTLFLDGGTHVRGDRVNIYYPGTPDIWTLPWWATPNSTLAVVDYLDAFFSLVYKDAETVNWMQV